MTLKRLLEVLRESVNCDDDDRFIQVLRLSASLLNLSDQDISDKLTVSRPTITRWLQGKNLPHPAMRPLVISVLKKQTKLRIGKQNERPENQRT